MGIDKGTLCTICARGGSKGVRGKNIRSLAGLPLIAHTIRQAKGLGLFSHIVVSTDSPEIQAVAREYGAEVPFTRPAHLASDTAGKMEVFTHALRECESIYGARFDTVVDLDATSPLRAVSDIAGALELYRSGSYNNVITACPSRKSPYFNIVELDAAGHCRLSKPLPAKILRRQDAPPCYDMNASIYVFSRDHLEQGLPVINEKTGLYVMPEERSIDIDTELDFSFVEHLMRSSSLGTI